MADQLLIKALTQAFSLNIPILYTPTPETPLHIDNRLSIDDNGVATPIMRFTRNDDDTIYRLLLRINGETIDHLSQHSVVPLCHEPGYFIFDKRIVRLAEGFNAKLLAPFAGKEQVVIPRRTEKVYFQRFILKNVASAEVHAEGFDIKEERHEPHASIVVERTIDYRSMLTLYFEYGGLKYTVDSQSMGKVTLHETAEGFCFVRFPRDREGRTTSCKSSGKQAPYSRHRETYCLTPLKRWWNGSAATTRHCKKRASAWCSLPIPFIISARSI